MKETIFVIFFYFEKGGGLVVIFSLRIPEPQFEGQTKAKLGNPEVKSLVDEALSKI
jgi:DNA gyrase subunit B